MGPVFIRTGRPKTLTIYNGDQKFEIGKAVQLTDGRDVTIIANGLMVAAVDPGRRDAGGGGHFRREWSTCIPSSRSIARRFAAPQRKPARSWSRRSTWWMAGWVSASRRSVAETQPCPMEFVGIQDTYAESGQPEELLDKYGLVAKNVAAAARKAAGRKR